MIIIMSHIVMLSQLLFSSYSNHLLMNECGETDGDMLSGNQIFDLFHNRAVFLVASALMDEVILSCWSSQCTALNHNPIKWCREEQSSYSVGLTSQSLHPNPEEMGKWSFQLLLMAGPGPLGLRGPQSSDILELILFTCFRADCNRASLHVL